MKIQNVRRLAHLKVNGVNCYMVLGNYRNLKRKGNFRRMSDIKLYINR